MQIQRVCKASWHWHNVTTMGEKGCIDQYFDNYRYYSEKEVTGMLYSVCGCLRVLTDTLNTAAVKDPAEVCCIGGHDCPDSVKAVVFVMCDRL